MKRSIIVVTLFWGLITLLSAQAPDSIAGYRITGRVGGDYKGKVYLRDNTGGESTRLDSADVVDGKYSFSGSEVEFPRMVAIESKDDNQLAPFFLENGNITIQTANPSSFWNSKSSGTVNNEIFKKLRLDQEYTTDSIIAEFLIQQAKFGERDYAYENAEFKRRTEVSKRRSRELAETIVNRYPNEIISLYLLHDVIGFKMDVEKLESFMNKIDSEFNTHPYMSDLRKLVAAKKLGEGKAAPLFEIDDVNGKKISLADYKGKYVLLDFWASWCGPCLREIPNLKALFEKYKGSGKIEIIGISIDDDEKNWRNALEKHAMSWTQVNDLKAWNGDIAARYNVQSVPKTVLIDSSGNILAFDLRGDQLIKKIDELLK